MSEGPSRITGPIPPDPTLCPDYYRRPLSARGRLEGNSLKLDLLPGPLPPDATLYPELYSARLTRPPARIRPNAKDFLEMSQKGAVGTLLQLDGILFCQEMPLKRKECKNYEKENLRRMREIQKKCREKEQARGLSQPKPVKALWKSPKYENVESRLKTNLQGSSVPPKPEAQRFLRAYSRCGTGIRPGRPLPPNPAQSKAATEATTAPARSGNVKVPEGNGKVDFISHNAQNAKRAQLRRSRSLQSLTEMLEQKRKEQEDYDANQKGHVPRYLIERKEHWRKEAEERQRNTPDPAMPPGHSLMPESQRVETLNDLKQSQAQLLKELLLLSVRDTLNLQNRRVGLEKKLSQIDEALKIFSRPKVFIKLDS